MNPKRLLRPLAAVAAGTLIAGVVGFTATSAHADTIGPLTISPAAGNLDTTVNVVTDTLCPGGNAVRAIIKGAGFPAEGQGVTGVSSQSTVANGAGYVVPLVDTFRNIANLVSPAATYSGSYTITLTCRNAIGATTFGDFVGTLTFSDANTWAAAGVTPSPSPTTPVPSPTTTTPGPSPTTTTPGPSPTTTTPGPSPTTTTPGPSPTTTTPGPSPTTTTPNPTPSGDAKSVQELLNVTVPTGSLVISAASSSVSLPGLKLNDAFSQYSTTGQMADVSVTDTRAGAPGFTVTGQVSPFVNGANTIGAANLGWTPKVKSVVGVTATAGDPVAPGAGLASPKTLAKGTGLGTAVLGADLALIAPVTTAPGDYSATLTITVI